MADEQIPEQILILTAPTAVTFHVALGETLARRYPGVPVRFLSVSSLAVRRIRALGLDAVYLADLLNEVTGDELTMADFQAWDERLYAVGKANINLMMWSDKTLPKHGTNAEVLARKHVVVLDRLITPKTLAVSRLHDCFWMWLAAAMAFAKDGWYFGFGCCAVPPNSSVALKTPFERWPIPQGGPDPELLARLKEEIQQPVEKRLHYMKDMRSRRIWPGIKEMLLTSWHLLKDAGSGAGAVSYGLALRTITAKWHLYGPKLRRVPVDYVSAAEVEAEDAPFCFFPLQVEPEASIMCFSPWFRDQLEAIRFASQAIPVGWKVLVKEHPVMVPYRPFGYYRKLRKMPNVRLVSDKIPVKEMISRCAFVFTIAGTAATEAKIMGKPAYCLGRPPVANVFDGWDPAGDSYLGDFFARISRGDNRPLTAEDMGPLASGTFFGNAGVSSVGGIWQHDDSAENVAKFVDHMASAINVGEGSLDHT